MLFRHRGFGSVEDRRTVSCFFEVVAKRRIQAKVESVPVIVALLAANLAPLDHTLCDHDGVHGDDAEPEEVLLPARRQLQQRDSECAL